MTPEATRRVAEKAQDVLAKVRPGPMVGRRALPIRATTEEIGTRWNEPAVRDAVLAGIPVESAGIEVGAEDRDFGRTVHVELTLSAPVPGMAAQALAGKAVRRLKALVETGEVPTTDHNPSARADAGEEAL